MEYGGCCSTANVTLTKLAEEGDLKEILGIEQFPRLLEQIFHATGFASAVLDLNGNTLFKVGIQSICTNFHRKSEIGSMRCMKSDAILTDQLLKNVKYAMCVCQNGMVDAAIPIIIAERLVQLMRSIGAALSLPEDQLNELELLSTLHDIGKVSIMTELIGQQ